MMRLSEVASRRLYSNVREGVGVTGIYFLCGGVLSGRLVWNMDRNDHDRTNLQPESGHLDGLTE